MRRLFSLGLLLLFLLSLTGCRRKASREDVFAYVRNNQALLETFVSEDVPINRFGHPVYSTDELGGRSIVKRIASHPDGVVEFDCGGTGFSVSSTYAGFYYAPDDTPSGLDLAAEPSFEESSPGVYTWAKDGNEILTERILPCWFYYHIVWI